MNKNNLYYFAAAAVLILAAYFIFFSASSISRASKLEKKINQLTLETQRLNKINRELEARLSGSSDLRRSENELTRNLYAKPGDTVVELILPEPKTPAIAAPAPSWLWLSFFTLLILSAAAAILFFVQKIRFLRKRPASADASAAVLNGNNLQDKNSF